MKKLFLLFIVLVLTSGFSYSQQYDDGRFLGKESILMTDKTVNLKTESTIRINQHFNDGNLIENSSEKKFLIDLGGGLSVTPGLDIGWCTAAGIGYQFNHWINARLNFHYFAWEDYAKFFVDPTVQIGEFRSEYIYYSIFGFGYATGDGLGDCVTGILGGGAGIKLSEVFTLNAEIYVHYLFNDEDWGTSLTVGFTLFPF
ncbi:MAG: hypothetical protein JW917_07345 [Ignavibacteria bacterium]|nr:hypothetical protein [Ignavibacteria bacterium]